MPYQHQAVKADLSNPMRILSLSVKGKTPSEVQTEVQAVMTRLDTAGITFAASECRRLSKERTNIYVEPSDADQAKKALRKYPSKISVDKDGRVIGIEHGAFFGGKSELVLKIERNGVGFKRYLSEDRVVCGDLDHVLEGVYAVMQRKCHELFQLENPSEAQIHRIGFHNYSLENQ